MARIFQDGFETGMPKRPGSALDGNFAGSLWQLYQSNAQSDRSIGTLRTLNQAGLYSLSIFQSTGFGTVLAARRDLGENVIEHYGRAEIQILRADMERYILFVENSAHERIFTISSELPDLKVYVWSEEETLVGTISNPHGGSVFRLEWHLISDPVNGLLEIRIDGQDVLTYTGDTMRSAPAGARRIGLGDYRSVGEHQHIHYDDIAINDTSGPVNSSWCGKGAILLLPVNSNGHYQEFLRSDESQEAWQHISTAPPRGDQVYIYSDTFGDRASFGLTSLGDSIMSHNKSLTDADSYFAGSDEIDAYMAFDENTATQWSSGSSLSYVGVDFGGANSPVVSRLAILGRNVTRQIRDFTFQGSSDGTTWVDLINGTIVNDESRQVWVVSSPMAYRYYRIVCINNYGDGYNNALYDVRMYGTEEIDPEMLLKSVSVTSSTRWEGSDTSYTPFIRHGVTDHFLESRPAPTGYRLLSDILSLNPFTGLAWELWDLEDIETGVRHDETTE